MADERFEPRDINFRQWFPFTQIYRGFALALDHRKAFLAAAGILVMAFGWWLLAAIFFAMRSAPDWGKDKYQEDFPDRREAFAHFRIDRDQWSQFYEAAGPWPASGLKVPAYTDENDLAESSEEWEALATAFAEARKAEKEEGKDDRQIDESFIRGRTLVAGAKTFVVRARPHGTLRTWPWFEERGPNPFLLLIHNRSGFAPRTALSWLLRDELPVLIEPLVKFFRPVFYLLSQRTANRDRLYYVLVILWTLGTWAIFGGAITRIAAVELARNERVDSGTALRYAAVRWRSYLFASFAPLLGVALFLLILMFLFGLPNLIPFVAEFWDGILWPLVIGLGLVIAFLLIGLAGWPMIHTTLSTEGSDSYDALSRCYSYVLQYPWSYLWYVLNAVVYGAIVVFFVGMMASLAVYLGNLGLHWPVLTDWAKRDPSYMFVWAPTTFGWHDLLVQGTPYGVWDDTSSFRWYNYIGTFFVSIWLYLLVLMVVGFGYSYFWSASTIIYFLMRRKVDEAEFDEVYLEEEDNLDTNPPPFTSSAPVPATTASSSLPLHMVDAPALKTPSAASPPPSPPVPTALESSAPKPALEEKPATDPGLR